MGYGFFWMTMPHEARKHAGKTLPPLVELAIIADGPAKTLLQVCAQICFFDLSQICIKELCKTLGVNDFGDSLLKNVRVLGAPLRPEEVRCRDV